MKNEYIRTFYEKNKFMYFLTLINVMLSTSLSILSAYLLQKILDAATEHNIEKLIQSLIISLIYLLILFLVQLALRETRNLFVKRAVVKYKEKIFKDVTKKNISSFKNENIGTYISLLTNDTTTIENNYLLGSFEIIAMLTSFVGAVLLMLWYNWMLMLIVLMLCFLPIIISRKFSTHIIQAEKKISDSNEKYVQIVKDILNGFPVIKSFQSEKHIIKLFCNENEKLEDIKCKRRKIEAMITIISGEISFLIQIGVFIISAYFAIKGMITTGVVIAFVQLMNFIMEPIQQLPALYANRKAASELILKAYNCSKNNNITKKGLPIKQIDDGIIFNNVSFGYEEDSLVLKNINLNFKKNKSYAIVGSSGSGKSTLLNLLVNSPENYNGSIKINNIELRDINKESLYKLFSVLHQEIIIFDTTILNNITMFQPYSQDKVDKAVALAGLDELIKKTGYDYQCGENGVNLSGGERQRISIARCLLKNTSVLLMDEATSALDVETANSISNAILDINGLTRIVITHDLDEEVLKRFDEIIVLKNGVIQERGNFDKLIADKKYFYSLYNVSTES